MFSHLLVVLPGGLSKCRFSPVTSRNNMTAVKFFIFILALYRTFATYLS
jgi:putative component of membrane protein insertase Oxa1/YidC/SpoIIIJ protein YidD